MEFRLDTADTSGFIIAEFEDHGPYIVGDGVNNWEFIKFKLYVSAPGILQVGSLHTAYMWVTITSQTGGGQIVRTRSIPVKIM